LNAVCETHLNGLPPTRKGKVRDLYDLGDRLVIVATDRISAFDWINPVGIPDKGIILTRIALFWFDQISDIVPNHLISSDLNDFPEEFQAQAEMFQGRSMLVQKCTMFPVEFVIRGYLAGSGWNEYQENGTVCGVTLPMGLRESDRLPEPIYTPATKSDEGHDINISPSEADTVISIEWNRAAADAALAIYNKAQKICEKRGIILCDTKFEFGLRENNLILADEILTPDSSRFWPANQYAPGRGQSSYDKQFVRDYLETTGWDKNSPQPPLPQDIVEKTRAKYLEAYTKLTGIEDI